MTQHIVVIEWDGKQPPTSYYNGLRKLNLRVQTENKVEMPMSRRTHGELNAVTAQEGCIICPSESLARQVQREALNYGARSVMIGTVEFDTSPFCIEPEDKAVIDRFNAVFRRRGRPPATDEQQWHWWCPECNSTGHETQRDPVIQCGSCGGLRVSSKPGALTVWQAKDSDKKFDAWLKTRYANGEFMRPLGHFCPADIERKLAPDNPTIPASDLAVVDAMRTNLAGVATYLEVYDAIFAARRFNNKKDREEARTKVAVALYQRGFTMDQAPLFEPEQPDLLDAALVYGVEKTIAVFAAVNGSTLK